MRRRSASRNAVEYAAAWVAVQTLAAAPAALAGRMARGYASMLDRALPRLRRTALCNLQFALPDLDEAGRGRIAGEVFDSIARVLLAFAKFPRICRQNVAEWVRCEGLEHYTEAKRRGKGVLVATAHLGNWELSAYAHALLTEPMHVLVRPLDNPYIDRMVERRRTLSGNRVISKKDSARAILSALRRNEAVGILIDQNASPDNGVFVDFFGVQACAGAGFARLAAHSGATVIPGFATWCPEERRYVLRFYDPVPMCGDTATDTAAVQRAVEAAIRREPGQWLWIHRRWKTRPSGEAPLYG